MKDSSDEQAAAPEGRRTMNCRSHAAERADTGGCIMFPSNTPRPPSLAPRRARAFTLIEMLVVMGIIGILVALLFPAIRGAQLAADRADTERLTIAFEGAMKSFYNEYGRFPFQGDTSYGSPNIDKYYLIDDVTYTNLVACLRGLNVKENPKNIPFLDVPEKKLGEYKTLKSVLLDPWDSPFRVWADWSNNNEINTATPGNVYGTVRGRQVLIWSPGPDRQDGSETARSNRDDNVTSWGG
jgi:prepilin-type N-terminal cleavage/methylation domain-containing protein